MMSSNNRPIEICSIIVEVALLKMYVVLLICSRYVARYYRHCRVNQLVVIGIHICAYRYKLDMEYKQYYSIYSPNSNYTYITAVGCGSPDLWNSSLNSYVGGASFTTFKDNKSQASDNNPEQYFLVNVLLQSTVLCSANPTAYSWEDVLTFIADRLGAIKLPFCEWK